MRKKWFVAALIGLLLVASGGGVWYAQRSQKAPAAGTPMAGRGGPAEVSLKPVKADASGVDPAAGFVLTADKALKLADVKQALKAEPAVDLTVEAKSSKEFLVRPVAALDANRIYRFKLATAAGVSRTYQWSFQTRAAFRILGSLPRNQSAGVPVNTGIELIFSHENYADPGNLFRIDPPAPGKFERHKKTLAFVPDQPLKPGTVYTVTLKAGLAQTGATAKLTEEFRFSFETAPEGSQQQGGPAFNITEDLLEFKTGDAPYFLVYTNDKNQPVQVTVHRYRDATGFAAALETAGKVPWWANWAKQQFVEPTAALSQVLSLEGRLQEYEHFGTYLHLPEALPAGYYIASLKMAGEVRQVRFQVTDLSSYAAAATNKTLVWLNDLATGKPVAGARIQPLGSPSSVAATTDKDGVATVPTPAGAGDTATRPGLYLLAREAGGKEAVVALPWDRYYRYYGYDRGFQNDTAVQYWRYLYLDRQLYKPDDTINLWGVVRPREPGAQLLSEVTAVVTRGGYYGQDQGPAPLAKATLKVQNATFTGKLDLPGLKPGWYELQLRAGDAILSSRYFEVQNYVKPAYQITTKLSRRAIFLGESVDLNVKATFFEGTPVPNLPLNLSLPSQTKTVVTGADGTTTITIEPSASGWYANHQWYNVIARLPEAGEITDSGVVLVYPRDMQLSANVKVQAPDQAIVTGQINRVTLDAINAGDGWDDTGAPVAGNTVDLKLTEKNWIRTQTGTYYDFISKTTHPLYDYRPNDKVVGTFTTVTNSEGKFLHPLTMDPEKSYTVTVTSRDSKGGDIRTELWFSGKWYQGQPDTLYWGRWHNLAPLEQNKFTYALGEPATVELRREQAPVQDRPQSFLFYTARLGLQSYKVQDNGRFTYALKEADLPSITLDGVYFDGRTYYEASGFTLRFDPKERGLQVAVTADKPEYKPGETVQISVRTVDRQGRPVRAQVNLNLVDEAVYALRDQSVDLLQSLYGEYISTGILRTRRSHQVPKPNAMAEKGGDGGGVRKEFKDAVFFDTVTTDAQGRATASFKVPDNLTTWRVTWQALVPETLQAASGTTGVVVKLPFFVETVQADTYLTGDRPVISARTYGTALAAGDTSRLALSLTGPMAYEASVMSARAFDPFGLKLPALTKAGTYAVTVRADGPRGMQDAIEKPFRVVDSYLTQKKVDFQLLQPGAAVKGPETGMVWLQFTDYERGRYLRLLGQARWQGGNRLEQKLARQVADALLDTKVKAESFDTFAYQTEKGGIAYLPYADADLHLTALALDLAPDRFDGYSAEQYLQKILDDDGESRERKLIALYGMAAISRPVLLQAQQLLALKDLSLMEQFYLALALAELGDEESAYPLYQALLTEHGEQLGADARIKTGRDDDERLTHTALAGMLAAKLGEPEAPAFAGYLLTNWGKEVLLSLEEALIAADGLPRLAETPVSVTYSLDGKEERLTLKPGQTQTLEVTARQAATLQVKETQGKVGLTAIYETPLSRTDLKQRQGFSVVRNYGVVGRSSGTNEFKVGDLVRVTVSVKVPSEAPGGEYELTDYLPSGLRLVARPWEQGIRWGTSNDPAWPLSVDGQKATFWVGRWSPSITYYARVVTAGQYTAEEPILQHGSSGIIYGFGVRTQVKIE